MRYDARSVPAVHAALIAVQVLFGLWPVAGAAVLKTMSPTALVGFRLLLGAPILALIAGVPWSRVPGWRDLGALAVLAAFGTTVNQLLFVEGLSRAGPINASLMVLLVPAFALVFAAVLGVERPSRRRVAGALVAFAGAALLMHVERFDIADRRIAGDLMLTGNTASYALYLVLARPVLERVGSLRSMAWVFIFGAVETLPFTARAVLSTHWTALPGWAIGSLAYILIGATILTYVLNAYALRRVTSSVVAVFIYVQPVIAALGSWVVLGLLPTARTLVAAAVIFVGVAIALQTAVPRRTHKKA